MVGSVSSNVPITNTQQVSQNTNNNLTSSQLEIISSVLSNYDSSNLSSEDAFSIVSSFKEAGIKPSESLAKAMESEGFDAKEVGDLAGVKGSGGMPPPPPPPPSGSKQEETDISSLLDELLSIEEDQEEATNDYFDQIMEYTSRIINLNEQSKSEVMEMLDRFLEEDSEFSSEDKSNIIKNSLSQILSDPDNYNRVSFYA